MERERDRSNHFVCLSKIDEHRDHLDIEIQREIVFSYACYMIGSILQTVKL